jgi:hypothetical protein
MALPKTFAKVETNAYVRAFKASLAKRWSFTRMETLYEIFDLAAFLWALEREREALNVAAVVSAAISSPPPLARGGTNYNLWCPATFSHALVARLDTTGGEASRDVLALDPGVARTNPGYVTSFFTDLPDTFEQAMADKTQKWGCQTLARTLGKLLLYGELARIADPLVAGHGETIEPSLATGLSRLRERLADAHSSTTHAKPRTPR